MTIVSRISHVLCKPGALIHESYMSLYSYLVTAMVMPFLIFSTWSTQTRTKHFLEDVPVFEKVGFFLILFVLTLVKVFKMERGIMKRFVEDYDPEVHSNLNWLWCRSNQQQDADEVVLEDAGAGEDPEQSRNTIQQQPQRNISSVYMQHVNEQKRNTVNLACLQLLFLTCVYALTYEMGYNIEDDYE